MKASQFFSANKSKFQDINQNAIFGVIQRIEAEYAVRTDDEFAAPTGKFKDGIVDALYHKLREFMTDRDFVNNQERETLAELMNNVSY